MQLSTECANEALSVGRWIRCHGSSSVFPYLSVSICDCREQQCSSGRPAGKYLQNMLVPIFSNCLGVGARCWVPIIGTHTFRETLRPRACCAMCPEVHLLRPLAIIVAIVMNGLIGSAGAVLARGAPDCGARCSELSEYKSCLDISNI